MPWFTRTVTESDDAARHRHYEASAREGDAVARRMEAAETDNPSERARLLGRAKDADRQAKAIRRGR